MTVLPNLPRKGYADSKIIYRDSKGAGEGCQEIVRRDRTGKVNLTDRKFAKDHLLLAINKSDFQLSSYLPKVFPRQSPT